MGLRRYSAVITVVSIICVFVLIRIIRYFNSDLPQMKYRARTYDFRDKFQLIRQTKDFREQRNELSRVLNRHKQIIGQLECEKVFGQNQQTSESGGWCPVATAQMHNTDLNLVRGLGDFFRGKYVSSFGDGPGMYKKLLLEDGKVNGFDSYDGAPFCDETSEGRVQFLDLTLPQYGLPLYDWVLSLEVAEHIPEQFEKVFIDNIVRHAKEGVVLSWATPGQEGYSHVNMRTFEYVRDLMESFGFQHDVSWSETLRSFPMGPNLRRNINVFNRKDISEIVIRELLQNA